MRFKKAIHASVRLFLFTSSAHHSGTRPTRNPVNYSELVYSRDDENYELHGTQPNLPAVIPNRSGAHCDCVDDIFRPRGRIVGSAPGYFPSSV